MVVVVVIAFHEKMVLDFARIENFLADDAYLLWSLFLVVGKT